MVWAARVNNFRRVIYDTNIILLMEKPALILEILLYFHIIDVRYLLKHVIKNSDGSLKTENRVSTNDLLVGTFFYFIQTTRTYSKNFKSRPPI